MLATKTDERITARVNHETRELLERAASMLGSTLNQFLVAAARKEAEAVIERESVIRLSREESEAFFAALDRPAAPNERLKQAVRRYKESSLRVED